MGWKAEKLDVTFMFYDYWKCTHWDEKSYVISVKHSQMLTRSIAAVIPKWNQKTMEFR